jgi:hypothetical protein
LDLACAAANVGGCVGRDVGCDVGTKNFGSDGVAHARSGAGGGGRAALASRYKFMGRSRPHRRGEGGLASAYGRASAAACTHPRIARAGYLLRIALGTGPEWTQASVLTYAPLRHWPTAPALLSLSQAGQPGWILTTTSVSTPTSLMPTRIFVPRSCAT